MPITKERKKMYPSNWPELRAAVMERATAKFGSAVARCELCGLPNHVHVARHREEHVAWTSLATVREYDENPGEYQSYNRPVMIVLTVHHINNDPTDNRMCNLIALCQRCHNKLDAPWRSLKARQTRAEGCE